MATGTAAVAGYFEADGSVVVTNASATITWLGKTIGYGVVTSHSTDLKTAIIRTVSAKTGATTYSLYDFTNATSTNLSTLLRQSGIRSTPSTNMFVDPYDDTSIIAQTSAEIVAIDSEHPSRDRRGHGARRRGDRIPHRRIAVRDGMGAHIPRAPQAQSGTSQIIVYDKFSGDTVDDSLIAQRPDQHSSRGCGTTSSAFSQAITRSIFITCRASSSPRSPTT